MSWAPIEELADAVRTGKTTARSLVERSLKAIADAKEFNALINVSELALSAADKIDAQVKNGENPGRLAGVPFIAKDNYSTAGVETTAGSRALKGYIPPFSATAIKKLEDQGAVLVAKANLDAFAHGSSTENSDFGVTLNPHDKTRVAGGSSGGSAAAVALELAPFSLGSDTGGSIRLPASFCGVVGVKPTYGLVSRYGVVAMASSTDVMGPLATSVSDAAMVLDVIAGADPLDATSIESDPAGYTLSGKTDLSGLKVGLLSDYMGEGVSEEVAAASRQAADKLAEQGAVVKEVKIPQIDKALAVYYIVMPAEVSSNLSRYDGIRYGHQAAAAKNLGETYMLSRSEGFNDEVKRRVMLGSYVLSAGYYDAFYRRAQKVRTLLINNFNKVFEDVDVLLGPVSATTAFKVGENTDDPLKMYLTDIMTVSANLVGIPALSLPWKSDNQNLPIGVQLMAPHGHDRQLLSVAAGMEALR